MKGLRGIREKIQQIPFLKGALPFLRWGYHVLRRSYYSILFLCTPEAWRTQCVVYIDGGLGSQMGQYLLGQHIATIRNCPVSYDLSWYENYGLDCAGKEERRFELTNVFSGIQIKTASKRVAAIYRNIFYYAPKNPFAYDSAAFLPKKRRYFGGWYAHKKYFENCRYTFQDLFQFTIKLTAENAEVLRKIEEARNSIAIHIRRGDYIGMASHDVTTLEYFQKAVEYMKKTFGKCTFFCFSNDIAWCREHFSREKDFFFCDLNDNNHGFYDLFLMAHCKHFIVSNSSFSCAAAQLGRFAAKIVVAPFIFAIYNNIYIYIDDVIQQDWIKISYDVPKRC